MQSTVRKQFWQFASCMGLSGNQALAFQTLSVQCKGTLWRAGLSALFLEHVSWAKGITQLGWNSLGCWVSYFVQCTTHGFLFQHWPSMVFIIVIACGCPEVTAIGIMSSTFLITLHYLQFVIFIVIHYRPSNANPGKCHDYYKGFYFLKSDSYPKSDKWILNTTCQILFDAWQKRPLFVLNKNLRNFSCCFHII